MGDPSKFQTVFEYNMFNISLFVLIIMELVIMIVSHQKSNQPRKTDQGTRWLLTIAYWASILLSFFMVSKSVPQYIRSIVLPGWCSIIGILLIWIGIIVRMTAVLTLKRAFTLGVQTTKEQNLITYGIYRNIRNPAYTGSIVSLIGTAVSLRSIPAILMVFILCVFCYSKRIIVEEKALTDCFGTEFLEYKKHTDRLFPHIW